MNEQEKDELMKKVTITIMNVVITESNKLHLSQYEKSVLILNVFTNLLSNTLWMSVPDNQREDLFKQSSGHIMEYYHQRRKKGAKNEMDSH